MYALLLPIPIWDVINTACFNRKVLQIGVADGNDTIALASVAAITAVYVSVSTADIGRTLSRIEALDHQLAGASLRTRTLLHAVPALLGITQYHTDQFDIVFYNPQAADDDDPGGTLAMLAQHGRTLAIVTGEDPGIWADVAHALHPASWQCFDHGPLIIAQRIAVESTDSKEG